MKKILFLIGLMLLLGMLVKGQVPRKIAYPNNRIENAGTTNPVFITDIVNANLNVTSAAKSILGIQQDTGFVIISGLEPVFEDSTQYGRVYGSEVAYYKAPGYVMIKGVIYRVTTDVPKQYCLSPDTTNILSKVHGNGQSIPTYRTYTAHASVYTGFAGVNTQFSYNYAENIERRYLNKQKKFNVIHDGYTDVAYKFENGRMYLTAQIHFLNNETQKIIPLDTTIMPPKTSTYGGWLSRENRAISLPVIGEQLSGNVINNNFYAYLTGNFIYCNCTVPVGYNQYAYINVIVNW